MSARAEAARIVGDAIDQANKLINEANGLTPDMAAHWVVVIGCTDLNGKHTAYTLCAGEGTDSEQAPWVTMGLLSIVGSAAGTYEDDE